MPTFLLSFFHTIGSLLSSSPGLSDPTRMRRLCPVLSPAATAAGQARDDDVEEGDDAVDDGGEDGADAVDYGHQHGADGLAETAQLWGLSVGR